MDSRIDLSSSFFFFLISIDAVAGWGYTNASVELLSDNLMMTSVSVIPMRECNGSLSHNGTVPNSAFCAGSVSGGKLCHVNAIIAIFNFIIIIHCKIIIFLIIYI